MSSFLVGPEEDPGKALSPPAESVNALSDALPPPEAPSETSLSAAIDTLAYPMLALQPDGLLLHANLAARELLGQDAPPLEVGSDGRVAPRVAGQRGGFISALQSASTGQPQQLAWADGDLTVHLVLRPLAEASPGAPTPPVLVMLAPPPATVFDASGFANTHKLSAAETRVLEALLHGHPAEVTAQRLGVGVATVRSQIAAIRRKTGHDSVAGLLAALGDLPPLRRTGK